MGEIQIDKKRERRASKTKEKDRKRVCHIKKTIKH